MGEFSCQQNSCGRCPSLLPFCSDRPHTLHQAPHPIQIQREIESLCCLQGFFTDFWQKLPQLGGNVWIPCHFASLGTVPPASHRLRITEYPELGGTHKDHQLQLLIPHKITQNQTLCLTALSKCSLNSSSSGLFPLLWATCSMPAFFW